MNTAELAAFTDRVGRFTGKGLSLSEAERMADKLLIRDREGGDRCACLECRHLHGCGTRWRCGNWHAADVARDGLAMSIVLVLHRCAGFTPTHGV